jgi:hypothetical protein
MQHLLWKNRAIPCRRGLAPQSRARFFDLCGASSASLVLSDPVYRHCCPSFSLPEAA